MDFAGGRYQIEDKIGEGGEGIVYVVHDVLRPTVPIALKKLSLAGRPDLVRFLRGEFHVLSTLEHPRLARVHDLGVTTEDGKSLLYYTREFMQGEPLEVVAGAMAPVEAVRLVLEILRALRPLHRSGLVHGDLKPANVIVDESAGVRLIDFALAGTLEQGAETLPTGTLRYISPEMLEGRVPDGRGDFYALGVMLVELLTGRAPFTGTAAQVARGHLRSRVRLPKGFKGKGRISRKHLDVLVGRLAAREPSERFPTLDEAEAALMNVLGTDREDPHARRAPLGGMHARAQQRDSVMSRVMELSSGNQPGATSIAVLAQRGGGRSSFLRGLRWELQLEGVRTIEVDPNREPSAGAQLASILGQLVWLGRGEGIAIDRFLDGFVQGDQSVASRRLESGAAALSRALLKDGPLAVLVDDLHAMTAKGCAALRIIGASSGDCHPCFVVTAPQDESASLPVLGEGCREDVVLATLDDEDLASMVRVVIGRDDSRLVGRLAEVTGGNPALASHYVERAAREGPRLDGVEDEPLPDRLAVHTLQRLDGLGPGARTLLDAIALHGRPARREWLEAVTDLDDFGGSLEVLMHVGLVQVTSEGFIAPCAAALCAVVRDGIAEKPRTATHARWVDVLADQGAPEHLVLYHRAHCARIEGLGDEAVEATTRLESLGELAEAERLLGAVQAALVNDGPQYRQVCLARAKILGQIGRPSEALELLDDLGARDDEVRLIRGRTLASLGRREDAAQQFERIVDSDRSDERLRMDALREVAIVRLHLGSVAEAVLAVDDGLERAGLEPGADRCDLLCTRALAHMYQERLDEARADGSEALRIARGIHDGKLRTRAHWIIAMIHQRGEDLHEAAGAYRQAVEICVRTDDTGNLATLELNLGTLLHRMGEFEEAIDRYLSAVDYGRASGKPDQAILARINLGWLLTLLGQHERARLEGQWALEAASKLGLVDKQARAEGLLGDVAYNSADPAQAVAHRLRSIELHEKLGNAWEAAEVRVELALAMATKDPPDLEVATRLVETVSEFVGSAPSQLLSIKLMLARATIHQIGGEHDLAIEMSRRALADSRKLTHDWDDFSWQCFAIMARAHRCQGSDLLAARSIKRAVEALEEAGLKVPARFARGFADDPRRRIVQEGGHGDDRPRDRARHDDERSDGSGVHAPWRDTLMRLMEINRRLATTRDPDTLVDVILDSAVEFTGAERGLLLMPRGDDELEVASARDFYQGAVPEEHMDFSTSIARQVHQSAEPVITVSAMEDDRFGHARSVHELKLQSILCLPIKGRTDVHGVLYLENRLRSGKFHERDRDLLGAFCDQLAITIETARLIQVSRNQAVELEKLSAEREKLLERRTRELKEARKDLKEARSRLGGKNVYRALVGSTPSMRRVFSIIERVGESDVPVVITGESGTGKEMVARAIHAGTARMKGPFVAVNCGALPAELLESELFGHVRGAFTGAVRDKKGVFALASDGSLLLDEVGDMPSKMQLDLLRVLQENVVRPVGSEKEFKVDARVLAASQTPLDRLVAEGRFREDLFYRMNVVEVRIPPLRERADDIPILIDHFLASFALRYDTERKSVSKRAVRVLMQHDWPGNVRQLEHALLNAWVLSDARVLDVDDFETLASGPTPGSSSGSEAAPAGIEDEQRRAILDALKSCRWNKTEAARKLGIPRRTFYRKLRKYGLLK